MANAVPQPRYTYGDYRRWQGDERWELVDGEACAMSPAPNRRHQEILGELYFQLRTRLREQTLKIFVAPLDVRLPHGEEPDDEIDTVLQPDLIVVCDATRLDEAGVRGAPDLVVEVLSPSTSSRDEVLKRHLYERHGVREYWLIDPRANTLRVFHRGPRGLDPPVLWQDGQQPSRVLPTLKLDLAQLFRP